MKVYNKHHKNYPSDAIYIGRPSKHGNRFVIGQFYKGRRLTREDVMDLYVEWLKQKLQEEPTFVDDLIDKDVLCWCAPLPCHGDILLEAAEKRKKER